MSQYSTQPGQVVRISEELKLVSAAGEKAHGEFSIIVAAGFTACTVVRFKSF